MNDTIDWPPTIYEETVFRCYASIEDFRKGGLFGLIEADPG